MDNPEKMVTFGTQDKQSKKQRKYEQHGLHQSFRGEPS